MWIRSVKSSERIKKLFLLKRNLLLLLALGLLSIAGCNRNDYTRAQLKLAESGDYFARYNLWECYYNGTHGVKKDDVEANKWLHKIAENVWVVKFEPINQFNPKNPGEFLQYMFKYTTLNSGKTEIGKAGFFRTTKEGGKLVGSFLTNHPDTLQQSIEQIPDLKVISAEQLTPNDFIEYVAQGQQSL
jgi:hypothetical protein